MKFTLTGWKLAACLLAVAIVVEIAFFGAGIPVWLRKPVATMTIGDTVFLAWLVSIATKP